MKCSSIIKEFTRQFDFADKWKIISDVKGEGIFSDTSKKTAWILNDDYSSLVNDNSIKFKSKFNQN